jgi:hypothetical protein
MVPPNPEPPSQQQRISHPVLRTVLNLVMLVVICRDSFIIRGDGPNGFGELAIKILILLLSLVVGLVGLASAAAIESSDKPRPFLSFVDFFATLWLALFGAMAIFGACADNGGYCRRWSLFL